MISKNDYNLFIYVTNNSLDNTFNNLKCYINTQIIKIDQEHLDEQLVELVIWKYKYNQVIDKQLEPSHEILDNLYINDFYKDRIHIFILIDNSIFIL